MACVAGKYKSAAGSGSCDDCPAASNSPIGSIAIENCICNAGWSGPDGGPCKACAAGTFKALNGNETCSPCAAGSKAIEARTDCICLPGFFSIAGNCKDIFNAFDDDGDSRINKKEYTKGFDTLDVDKSGIITGQEFGMSFQRFATYFKIHDKDDDDRLFLRDFETGFDLFDVDGSGFITREELYGYMTATRLNVFNLGDTIAQIRCVCSLCVHLYIVFQYSVTCFITLLYASTVFWRSKQAHG
jgi:Ca2+-binding EF-hand superfamily protein